MCVFVPLFDDGLHVLKWPCGGPWHQKVVLRGFGTGGGRWRKWQVCFELRGSGVQAHMGSVAGVEKVLILSRNFS